jgi:hypothetical protein
MMPYPSGSDLTWLAIDENGYIGAFMTNGDGPLPVPVLQLDEGRLEVIENDIYELDEISLSVEIDNFSRPSFSRDMNLRGLFSFDWMYIGKEAGVRYMYGRISAPTRPLLHCELPQKLRSGSAIHHFVGANFEKHEFICSSRYANFAFCP